MPINELPALSTTERLRHIENFVINFPRLQRVREQLAWCQPAILDQPERG